MASISAQDTTFSSAVAQVVWRTLPLWLANPFAPLVLAGPVTINGVSGSAGLTVNTSSGVSTLTVNDNGSLVINGIADSIANTLTIGNNSVAGQMTVSVVNTNTADATDARIVLTSGATTAAWFVANAANSSAYVTGGPTGAQTVFRTLGATPIIFGTINK